VYNQVQILWPCVPLFLLHRLVDWAKLNPIQTAAAYSRFFGLGPVSKPFGVGLYFLVVATPGVIQN
jgi:hypothetical protein